MWGSCCFLRLCQYHLNATYMLSLILMVANEAEVIVFQLLFLLSYLSIRDHLDSFIRCYQHICKVEYGDFFLPSLVFWRIYKTVSCKSCICDNVSIHVRQVLLEIIFFIKQTDNIFFPKIISIHTLRVKDLRSFSRSIGNFGDENAGFWKTGPVLSLK